MDIDVAIDADDPGTWDLRDLLGRSMGCIVETDGTFTILPEGNASQTMADINAPLAGTAFLNSIAKSGDPTH